MLIAWMSLRMSAMRQALARHDWGFEGLRAEGEGCAAGTATHSSKLRMERNWQSQSFLSDHRPCGHFPPTECAGDLRAQHVRGNVAERSYSARWRCAFGGPIPHQTTPS